MDQNMTRHRPAGKSRRMSPSAGVAAIGLAIQLLTAPATGLTSLPLPSLRRASPSTPSSWRRCSENPIMTMRRPFPSSTPAAATATAAFERGGVRTPADTTAGWPRAQAPQRRLRRNVGHSPRISRPSVWGERVRCGAGRGDVGGGEGDALNDEDEAEDAAGGDRRYGAAGDSESPMAEKRAVGSGDDDSPTGPAFSFSALEDELRTRSAETTETRRADVVRGGGGGGAGGGAGGEESAWWPRILPPPLPGQGDDDGDAIQPLIELPLDGVLLQLFPALLIGVAGLILTVAVQVEAGRFDAMVGENGGAVVVTDLRDTRTQQQQQQQQERPQQP